MKFTMLLLTLLFQLISSANTGKEYLQKINANYKGMQNMELDMHYRLYKGHQGTELKKEYIGIYKRHEKQVYRKIENTEFINFKKVSLKINHNEKMFLLSDAQKIEALDVDLKSTLKYCKDVKVSNLSKGKVRVSLILKDMHPFAFSKISIEVDKNYWIQKITVYYVTKSNFGTYLNPDMDYPKLEITYGKIKKTKRTWVPTELRKYYVEKKGTIILSEPYKNYKIIDARK